MVYLKIIHKIFTCFMEEGFEPSDTASDRCLTVINMCRENAFKRFSAGISFTRMLCVSSDKVVFPQADVYEALMHSIKEESDGK